MMEDSPLTLQLAARVERLAPPTVAEICAAAGLATIALLGDTRSQPGGPWHHAVSAWNGARIRKLVRRGRGAAWERAQAVAGVTARVGAAEVRAFVPGPRDNAPSEVQRLQIQSPPLPAPTEVHRMPRFAPDTLVAAMTPELWMSWGKQAAQVAHGIQRLWEREAGTGLPLEACSVEVIHPCPVLWAELAALDPVEIRDGGFTEIPAGTLTVRAFRVSDTKWPNGV